jgi:hypothetical protein
MASRIRSGAQDNDIEHQQYGRTLMHLVLDIVSHSHGSNEQQKQTRILMRLARAMMAVLRSAPRAKTRIYLSDLSILDDVQFEQILEGFQYTRSKSKRATMRGRRDDQAH